MNNIRWAKLFWRMWNHLNACGDLASCSGQSKAVSTENLEADTERSEESTWGPGWWAFQGQKIGTKLNSGTELTLGLRGSRWRLPCLERSRLRGGTSKEQSDRQSYRPHCECSKDKRPHPGQVLSQGSTLQSSSFGYRQDPPEVTASCVCWLEAQIRQRVDSWSNPQLFSCPTLHPHALILREERKRNSTIYWHEDRDWYLVSKESSLIEVPKWHVADKFCISWSFPLLSEICCQYFKIVRLHLNMDFQLILIGVTKQISRHPQSTNWLELSYVSFHYSPHCFLLNSPRPASLIPLPPPVPPTEPDLQASGFQFL